MPRESHSVQLLSLNDLLYEWYFRNGSRSHRSRGRVNYGWAERVIGSRGKSVVGVMDLGKIQAPTISAKITKEH
jgi:hypothetical protein